MRAWIIRAGDGGKFVDEFVDGGYVGLGYDTVPDLRRVDRWDIERTLERAGSSTVDVHASILLSFLHEVLSGDLVVLPDSGRSEVVVGTVDGPYDYAPGRSDDDHPHRRKVRWLARHRRADLPAVLAEGQRQRIALRRVDSPSLDAYLQDLQAGSVGRSAEERDAPRAARSAAGPRAPRAPRAPRLSAPAKPKKAEVATRRCEVCFQTKPVTQFDGESPYCRDCE